MINNRYILFLLSHPRSRSFHREASTIQPSAFLKFDVAKLGWETRENKKMASTTDLHKPFKNKELQKQHLYKEEKAIKRNKQSFCGNLYRQRA